MTDTERIDELLKTRAWRLPLIRLATREQIDEAIFRGNPDRPNWVVRTLNCREPGQDWQFWSKHDTEEEALSALDHIHAPQGYKIQLVNPKGKVDREEYIA